MNPPDSRRTQQQQAPRKGRRLRAARACERSRIKKYKCDEELPCCHCANVGGDEQYEDLVSPVQEEDTDVDRQTKAIEFHDFHIVHRPAPGPSDVPRPPISSSEQRQQPLPFLPGSGDSHGRFNLVSELRNTSFTPRAGTEGNTTMQQRNLYVKEAQYFIDAYFQNFHFIHPFIDKEVFGRRAADMWAVGDPASDMCFFCTYLGLMSLGALIGEWEWEEDRLEGLNRFEWSRKLFDEALANLADLHFPANLDTVHCLYLCAKVCQNELNHNMAYLYSGFAVRICLTAGFNQDNGGGGFGTTSSSSPSSSQQISRTWWGLYSLEMELSFALGRPDTLGLDEYHDRPIPPVDDSEFAIIPLMVDFARIVRRIAIGIYHSPTSWQQRMARAHQACLSFNVIIIFFWMSLFRPFLSMLTRNNSGTPPPAGVAEAVDKCIASAKRTIEVVHEAMIANSFFRTWWMLRVEILEAMDECMVARKSANIIRHMLAQVKGQPTPIPKTTAEFDNNRNVQPHLDESIAAADNEGSEFFMNDALDFNVGSNFLFPSYLFTNDLSSEGL
ncbi:hypothetical protein INS49_003470 [Diaporthe citri]|uniref:uncharacterized protein n=1 Tax=Diaporthe citri TaxID=83186 RepID=UPI001C81DE6A|nr:uncharacterized protein INS49_003470 [Diaporthe citri]KAG6355508.1 hypothetical protein INS49_003470 [Diaporthe citri]